MAILDAYKGYVIKISKKWRQRNLAQIWSVFPGFRTYTVVYQIVRLKNKNRYVKKNSEFSWLNMAAG